MLNPWRLRLLVELRRAGTMHAVAERVRLSPSTVSQQLALLEREAGVPLLERSGRRVRLTAAGAELSLRAEPVLDQLDAVDQWVRGEHDVVRGEVRVAAFASVLSPVLIPAAMRVQERYPDVTLSLREAEPDEALPALERGEIDIVLSARFMTGDAPLATPVDQLVRTPLLRDTLRAVLPAAHRLAGRTSLTLRDLADEPWALEPASTYLARSITTLCADLSIEPRIGGVFRSHESLLRSVQAGLHVSVLPELALATLPHGVVSVALTPPVVRQVEAVARPVGTQRAAVRAVTDELVRAAHTRDLG